MERIVEIDLINENDLLEKYNKNKISKDLINYIVKNVLFFSKEDKIKLIINSKLKINVTSFIKEGFKEEYQNKFYEARYNKYRELIYFFLGMIAIFISTLIDRMVFKEIILIGGWVLIWQVIELEIFADINNRKQRRVLKRLLSCEIIENNI